MAAHQRTSHTADRFNFSTSTSNLLGNAESNLESTPHKTGLVYCAAMGLHAPPDPASEHPERPERILRIYAALRGSGCLARMRKIVPRAAKREEIELFHESGMYDGLERTAAFSRHVLAVHSAQLEAASSLYLNEHTALCARLSCGSVIEMCDAVASRRIRNGFAVVRPPGHHAEGSRAMGFCFYNNVVVATKFLQQKYARGKDQVDKVLILDWDVHHGNGTQQAFLDAPDTLYISLHRYEDGTFYPGGIAGGVEQVGTGNGKGTNVNVPWPCAGMGDGDYLYAFQRVIMPIAQEYNPDFVIISAGFDAADGDEIGGMHVSPKAYAHMTHMLSSLANGRLVVVLEGGYNLDATAQSALAVTKTILGEAPEAYDVNELGCGLIAQRTVHEVAKVQERYWKSIVSSELEPKVNDDAPLSRIGIPEIIRHHRARHLWNDYRLLHLPLMTNLAPYFQHAVFTSEHLLDAGPKNVLLFVHDLADLRAEKPVLRVNPHRELKAVIEATDSVLDWCKQTGTCVFDINLFPKKKVTLSEGLVLQESEAIVAAVEGTSAGGGGVGGAGGTGAGGGGPNGQPGGGGSANGIAMNGAVPGGASGLNGATAGGITAGGAAGVGPVTSGSAANTRLLTSAEQQAKAVNELLLYVWDNFVELSDPKTKVVLLGYGQRAGQALMNLIVEREEEMRRRVKGVSMVFGGLGTSLGSTLPLSAWVGGGIGSGLGGGGAEGPVGNGTGAGGATDGTVAAAAGAAAAAAAAAGNPGGPHGATGAGGIGNGPIGGANAGPGPAPHMYYRQRDSRQPATSSFVCEIPLVPTSNPDLRKWYKKCSRIFCAEDHPVFVWDLVRMVGRRAGQVEKCERAYSTMDVMRASWPGIRDFFEGKLGVSTGL
ncbi:Histone deacetylase hda1 [Tilletia horrida]|nr:Histone deacetylase hda1 [Tilletia horrida]